MQACDDVAYKENVQRWLEDSLTVLRKYDWLLDAYVLDFYVANHWEKLPAVWRTFLEKQTPDKLGHLLNENEILDNDLWPLELIALKQVLKQLCIQRAQSEQCKLRTSPILQHAKLKHMFTKSVKPKKRHEIEQMSWICQQSVAATQVDFVIDFGAGLGHLARVLGYGYGIRVCCLEMKDELNRSAELIDLQLETMAAKHLMPHEISIFQRPTHVTLCLNATMQAPEFIAIIKNALHIENDKFTFGIIGLHPCGDLGPILMRLFLHCKEAKFLNFVGCCYMKLSSKNSSAQMPTHGYPMSSFLSQKEVITQNLSYEAREISCHAIEVYCDRLKACDYEHLKVHSYRAAAERIIVQHFPQLKHSGLRSVKHTPSMKFADYFYKAVHGLPAAQLPLQELSTPVTHADLLHWQRIVIFYSLRLLLAPLVESIILYDRILFLMENNCQVTIKAIFDPRLSPRNHITAVIKKF